MAAALSVASCMFMATSPAIAQSAGKKPPVLLAQGQPQPAVPQGQTFEEEIIPQRYANNADVNAFINDMVARYDFDESALHSLFAGVSYSATAVKLVTPSPTPCGQELARVSVALSRPGPHQCRRALLAREPGHAATRL